jgi:hypothetical protein
MLNRYAALILSVSLPGAFTGGAALAQTELGSPAQVQKALGTLNRVVDHTDRLIKAKNYAHLLHENEEFKEGLEALDNSIKREPAEFKLKLKPLLSEAKADSQRVADAAAAHDDATLVTTHAAFADSVKAVLADFPASVQPQLPSAAKEKKED